MSRESALRERLAAEIDRHWAELRRAGRILHDDIGPSLSAAGFQLAVLDGVGPGQAPVLAAVREALEDAMSRVRALSQELNPSPVERAGLRLSLEHLVDSQRSRFQGTVKLLWRTESRIPPEAAVAFHRVAVFALDNAARHSEATRVKLTVAGARVIRMDIEDNGRGFDPSGVTRGLGLLLMRAAATRAGLTFLVDSVPGRSTIVRTTYAVPSPPRR